MSKRRLSIFLQQTILTVALNLPDSIAHAPQRWHSEQDGRQVAVRDPDEKEDGETELKHGSNSNECLGGQPAWQNTHDDRENEVSDAERDHVVADILDADSAGHIRLHAHTQIQHTV